MNTSSDTLSTVGWLLVIFGSIPVLIGIGEKNVLALIIGGSALFVAVVCIIMSRHMKASKSGINKPM